MEMQPMNSGVPEEKVKCLADAIVMVREVTVALEKMGGTGIRFDISDLDSLNKSIDDLSKERINITLGPGGNPCTACGGTGRE